MSEKRQMIRTAFCLALLVLASAAVYTVFSIREAAPAGSWGLHFQEDGQPPTGSTSSTALAAYDAVFLGRPDKPVIYLTFDAGYENGCTAQILDTLKAQEVPAAFFLVGNYLEQNPELVRRMAAEGHTVGNHTWDHPDMSRIRDEEAFRRQLQQVEACYQEITGSPLPSYYRPPQGIYSEENLAMAKSMGYRTVFWSLAYVDWNNQAQPTAQEAFSKLIPRIHPGAVVLLHSTSVTNAAILDELLTRWKDMGYTFGTLDELFDGRPA